MGETIATELATSPTATAIGSTSPWSFELGGIEVFCGAGVLDQLGELSAAFDVRRALVVSDHGVAKAGHLERARQALLGAGLDVEQFIDVAENPTTRHVAAGVDVARRHRAELLVAIGGGSAMDCTKGINFLYTNGGRVEDYWGKGKAKRPMLPSLGVPTTAGTGSEAQSFALITQEETHRKMACGDRKARFRQVLLDPELLASLPLQVAAASGLDAISHAVESYVTVSRHPVSQLLAREAWQRLERGFEKHLEDCGAPAAALDMLLGAHLAGAAIEASMLGAAHACANPLTARFAIIHGVAVGLMLPHVVRFNSEVVDDLYRQLVMASGLAIAPRAQAGDVLGRRLEELQRAAGVSPRLRDQGVTSDDVPLLAADAALEWTGRFNPRPSTDGNFEQLYARAL